jgi:hypothetical protein
MKASDIRRGRVAVEKDRQREQPQEQPQQPSQAFYAEEPEYPSEGTGVLSQEDLELISANCSEVQSDPTLLDRASEKFMYHLPPSWRTEAVENFSGMIVGSIAGSFIGTQIGNMIKRGMGGS